MSAAAARRRECVVRLDEAAPAEEGAMREDMSETIGPEAEAPSPEDAAEDVTADAAGDPAAEEAEPVAGPDLGGQAAPEGAYALPPRMRAEDAEALIGRLRETDPDAALAIDAGAVEALTTPAVLALVAAARERAERGRPLAVERPSPAFIDAFSDLGLFHDLMKMEFRR